jgi:hypothetical protein
MTYGFRDFGGRRIELCDRIDIQDTVAIVPSAPMMAGTLTT